MSANFITMHHGKAEFQLDLDTEPKPVTDPGNILGVNFPQLFLPQHTSPKIAAWSYIWISPCCYGNRHPTLLARLIRPELVVPFKKKHLHMRLLFTPKCHRRVLLLNRTSVGELSAKTDCACQTHPKALDLLETPCLTRIELESKWQLIYTKGFSYWIEQPELAHSPLL